MERHVIWFGPVSAQQRAGATVAGAAEHFVTCTGNGAPGTERCRTIAAAWADADGRHLPGLLRKLGIPEDAEVFLGAFSAGGQILKMILGHPADRAAVRAVCLADGMYELAGADGRPAPTPSFVDAIVEAIDGDRFFFGSVSSAPNNASGKAEPSGSLTLERIVADVEARLGRSFDQGTSLAGTDLKPSRVWSLGPNVVLADFGATYRHEEHATVLAPIVWPAVLQPWLDARGLAAAAPRADTPGPAAAPEEGSGLTSVVAVVCVTVVVALLAARRARRSA